MQAEVKKHMTKQEKINRIKAYLAKQRGFCVGSFESNKNVILERDSNFFFEAAQCPRL